MLEEVEGGAGEGDDADCDDAACDAFTEEIGLRVAGDGDGAVVGDEGRAGGRGGASGGG